jgi:glycosyltransferase involved in cell wall biosynthesis
MKVLHIGDIAGVPQVLAAQQKREGILSDVLVLQRQKSGYEYDYLYLAKGYLSHGYFPTFRMLIDNIPLIMKYDVLHFHYSSLWVNGIDFLLWKMMGKRIVMHYHGSDIRGKGEKSYRRRFSDVTLVSTPDLLQYAERAEWIPNPIDIREFKSKRERSQGKEINILHLPTNRAVKGTEYVISAVEELKREGYKINFTLVEGKPHHEVIGYYEKADIVVDQLLGGWYGVVTIEAMALKKAVCVYIREDLMKYLPSIPFCVASKEDIVYKLKRLIEEKDLRAELGEKGRKFVEQIHDVTLVNKKVMSTYKR